MCLLPPLRCHNLTLAELSLVDEPSEVLAALVAVVEIMKGVVAEFVVGGRGVAFPGLNTGRQSLPGVNAFVAHALQLANAH